jgi:hypothetical protein
VGSVGGTVFQKNAADVKYHHRQNGLNLYYAGLMDFARGDEVLQVGHVSLITSLKYFRKRSHIKKLAGRPMRATEAEPPCDQGARAA